ncbi:hypothetical protein GCM10020218_075810 [Dactylosporangium vinaceum]
MQHGNRRPENRNQVFWTPGTGNRHNLPSTQMESTVGEKTYNYDDGESISGIDMYGGAPER